jgi:tripeptidyl-peptidase-1
VTRYVNSQRGLASWPLSPTNSATNGANGSVLCSNSSVGRGDVLSANKRRPSAPSCVYARGYPDLSLLGDYVPTVTSGAPLVLFGTSASSPTFAGLVAELNAAIRATPGLENKKIGYMNPFLYWAAEQYEGAFVDVALGSNRYASSDNSAQCTQGYNAVRGWDAATGLGVPQMSVLQKAAVKYVARQQQQAAAAAGRRRR